MTAGALKGAVFAANVYERLGFRCIPNATETRHDIIQCVELGSAEHMVAFCKGIQAAAPVDSYVDPIPWAMPGYDSEVIMPPARSSRARPSSCRPTARSARPTPCIFRAA